MTTAFSQTIQARALADPRFARVADGRRWGADLRRCKHRAGGFAHYINAMIRFEELADATGTPSKSLMRMFGPKGSPNAKNLFSVIGVLQEKAGVSLHVEAGR